MTEKELERLVNDYLEDNSLEDFLELHNISVIDNVLLLYDEGFLDDLILERMKPTDA